MEFIIGGLVIILCLYITGVVVKKKYYKEIDRLEAWKIDIMHRPILEEMSKVKQLNMTGQTEELFEKWRNEWDDIVSTQLPDVEDYLFDAEDYIDKYRFRKAKEIQRAIGEHLTETEENIKDLLNEINDLVGSEEKSRQQIGELREVYRVHKKMLLAHRYNFGIAEKKLEQKLDEVVDLFQQFDERTENGDYLEARETVLLIESLLQEISHKMEIIPDLLVECQSKIPAQLDDVREGYREMVQQGYVLDHIPLNKEMDNMQKELDIYKSCLENIETDEVEKGISGIKDNIDLLYNLLEEEVHAKQYVHNHDENTNEMLQSTLDANDALKEEIQQVLQSYHLTAEKIDEQTQLEKSLAQLYKRFELLQHKIKNDDTANTLLRDELNEIRNQLENVNTGISTVSEKLQELRKDELVAREKVQELSRKIADAIRIVSKNNIPGLPQDYLYLLDDAKESIQNLKDKLAEKPLEIPAVNSNLEMAEMTVEKAYDTTVELVETVNLAEKVIQYGNRYRSAFPSVERGLREAETSFRSFAYQTALEQAATCIEEVEKGALKRIEALLEEEVVED
jgi:septation ring formation regulator